MSLSKVYRDQPVQAINRHTRGPAYACFTEKDCATARDHFHQNFISLISAVGPWAEDALPCLYNYLIASIKLYNYDEAEDLCKYILGLLDTLKMSEESCFMCLECILAASYYLSGKLEGAEDLYTTIKSRGSIGDEITRNQFNVLSLLRLTQKDCLVFWQTSLKLSILILVTDYVTQLEDRRPKKNLVRSGLRLLRRMASLQSKRITSGPSLTHKDTAEWRTFQVQKALHQVTAMFDLGFEKRYTTSKLPMPVPIEETVESVHVDMEKVVTAEHRNKQDDVETAAIGVHKVSGWLEDQIRQPPIPDEPLDNGALGLTYRSMETTTSSVSVPQYEFRQYTYDLLHFRCPNRSLTINLRWPYGQMMATVDTK